jgi:hypothetical protein
MKKGLLVETNWVVATADKLAPGTKVRIKKEYGGGSGEVIDMSPSGKFAMVKRGRKVDSFDPSDLLIKESVYADMLKEFNLATDMNAMGLDQVSAQPDPDLQRINMYRARIARDQMELSKLVMSYTKKKAAATQKPKTPPQKPGTYTPAQMQAMQRQSAANAMAAAQQQAAGAAQAGFPMMQQTKR